jgi:peptidoglycan/LPS O-acetylase OafA/YrhL
MRIDPSRSGYGADAIGGWDGSRPGLGSRPRVRATRRSIPAAAAWGRYALPWVDREGATVDQLPASRSFVYNPALDGLRAVAIIGVLVFHTTAWLLPGGFVGVDVFFVLSGYLITSIIVGDRQDGSFSVREFYLRRVQRLMPTAVLVIAATLAISWVLLTPALVWSTARHGIFALFSLSNVYSIVSAGGYWGDDAATYPLLHTWSLAAEEQFYLVFPAALLLLFLMRDRRIAIACTGAVALASLGLAIVGTATHPTATFYLLPTRMWELLLGALFALVRMRGRHGSPSRRWASARVVEAAGWAGLALIVFSFFAVENGSALGGLVMVLPTVGALLVLVAVADGGTRLSAALSVRPLTATGKISYALYLWHWPLIVIGTVYAELAGWPLWAGALAGAAVSVVASVVTHRWVEGPMRRRGRGRRLRLAAIGLAFAALVGVSLVVVAEEPVADPLDLFDPIVFSGALYESNVVPGQSAESATPAAAASGSAPASVLAAVKTWLRPRDVGRKFSDLVLPGADGGAAESWQTGGVVHRWGGATPRIVVIGSSHATMYGKVIDDVARRHMASVAFLAASGTPTLPAGDATIDPAFYETRDDWIRTWRPDIVIVIGRWCTEAPDGEDLARRLGLLVGGIKPHAGRVVLVAQVPTMRIGEDINLRDYITWYLRRHGTLPSITEDEQRGRRADDVRVLQAVADRDANVEIVRADRLFSNVDGSVRYAAGRTFYYSDDDHLSDAGAALVEPLLESVCGPLLRVRGAGRAAEDPTP